MIRKDREVSNISEIISAIKRCKICHLALKDGEFPYVVPMSFGFAQEGPDLVLYFHGASEGKKHDLIKKDNKASFSIINSTGDAVKLDGGNFTVEYESVLGTGFIKYLSEEEKAAGLKILMSQYGAKPVKLKAEAVAAVTLFKLIINELWCKRRQVYFKETQN